MTADLADRAEVPFEPVVWRAAQYVVVLSFPTHVLVLSRRFGVGMVAAQFPIPQPTTWRSSMIYDVMRDGDAISKNENELTLTGP